VLEKKARTNKHASIIDDADDGESDKLLLLRLFLLFLFLLVVVAETVSWS
jgi:hypothetical protein